MVKNEFEILGVLNHNTLLCRAFETEETYVFFGKGIGFKKKKGEKFIYNDNVENAKLVLEEKEAYQYKELIKHVDNKELINVVQNVVYEAFKFFDNHVNAKLNLTLLDHLNFAIERQKQNIQMNYPFLNELQFIYPKEYEFSKKALAYINEQMKGSIVFDDSELGFLVLHIHAAVTDEKVSKVLQNNKIMYEATQVIEEELKEQINRNSIYYARFTKHLEYAIQRSKNGIQLENVLLDSIKEACNKEFVIANKIKDLLNHSYHIHLDDDEIGYLALHIYNLKNRKNQY